MAVYIIEGSTPLHGNIRVHGAKNAALPVLAAALLPPESEIEGCPRLSDTAAAMNILRSLGCRVEQQPDGSSEKPACTLYYSDGKQQQKKLDQETAKQLRAYFTELALCLLDEQP